MAGSWSSCITAVILAMATMTAVANEPVFRESRVWAKNEESLWPYHVPGVLVTNRGTVLVWADARYETPGDFSPHHMVLKRSTDGGKTFRPNQYIGRSDKREIFLFGNAVQPRGQERIHFLYTQKDPADIHKRTFIWRRYSEDEGATWSEPERIEEPLIQAEEALQGAIESAIAGAQFEGENAALYGRRQFYTGPGKIIQLRADHPTTPNRIVVPLLVIGDRNHRDLNLRGMGNAVMISDNEGKTWKAGGTVPIAGINLSEPDVIELADGTLLINSRIENDNRRAISLSSDGGMTWNRPRIDDSGIPPFVHTHAGLLRASPLRDATGRFSPILFSFPNSKQREDLTLLTSYDEHHSWSVRCLVHKGPSYYSNMTEHDGAIYLIYGRGGDHMWVPAETVLARFNLAWIRENAAE